MFPLEKVHSRYVEKFNINTYANGHCLLEGKKSQDIYLIPNLETNFSNSKNYGNNFK